MRFRLNAHMDPVTGKYNASLYVVSDNDSMGELVESVTDLRSVRAVRAWAQGAAEDYKANNTPEDVESHSYSRSFHL